LFFTKWSFNLSAAEGFTIVYFACDFLFKRQMKAATVYEFEEAGAHAMADISPPPAPAMPHPPTTSISPAPSLVLPRRKSCTISYKV